MIHCRLVQIYLERYRRNDQSNWRPPICVPQRASNRFTKGGVASGISEGPSPAPDETAVIPVLTIQATTADEQARERDLQEPGKLHNESLQAYVCDRRPDATAQVNESPCSAALTSCRGVHVPSPLILLRCSYDVNVTPDKRKVFLQDEREILAALQEVCPPLHQSLRP